MRRVLMYSHDTFGLGNIRRMLTIATDLVDNDPDLSVLILSGSPMLHAFRIPPRVDYLKLPCLARTLNGDYTAKYLDMTYEETIRLRANLCASAILDFEPDVFIVDKKPLGVGNELAAAIELAQRRGKPTKLVLLLRDILDCPETTCAVWRKQGYFDVVDRYYQKVLVVGSEPVFDLAREYCFPDRIRNKVEYCGYLEREPSKGAEKLRLRYARQGKPTTLVTPGGGEDGFRLVKQYLNAIGLLPEPARPHSIIVCGPEMRGDQRSEVIAAAARIGNSIQVLEFAEDMIGLMEVADLVVSMSGYNTVCELLSLKKRAILVPRVQPVQEQWIRAQRLAQLGLATTIHPEELTPAKLASALTLELSQVNVYRHGLYQIDLDGLRRVREIIGQLAGTVAHCPDYRHPVAAVMS